MIDLLTFQPELTSSLGKKTTSLKLRITWLNLTAAAVIKVLLGIRKERIKVSRTIVRLGRRQIAHYGTKGNQ
jgi:hypothetical protein